jgi:hypothetical protein
LDKYHKKEKQQQQRRLLLSKQVRIGRMSAKDSERPEKRLTLLFIAAGGIFVLIGTVLGAFMLASLSGVVPMPSLLLFSDHPYLQIFGFLSEFVCGISYSIIPLFKSKKLANPKVAYAPFSLITAANILSLIAVLIAESHYVQLSEVVSSLILVSSIIFCFQILGVVGRSPSKLLKEAEPFLSIAPVSFVLVSAVFFLSTTYPSLLETGGDLFSAGFIYLSLAGFVGSMIFGVELKTVAFRMTNYRKKLANATFILQVASVGLSFLSVFRGLGYLCSVASVSFLFSAVCFALSIRIFEGKTKARILLPMTEGRPHVASHNSISDYSDVCIFSSTIWLLFSFALGVAWQFLGIGDFAVRDSFIHSLAIGFIGSAIITYAVVLLPGVISQRAPKQHLSLLPLLFLNAGLIIRVAGNFYSTRTVGSLPFWESSSGAFIIVAMVILLINMHSRK